MRHAFLEANDLRFHYAEQGMPDAPLVLLLHGFPDFWYSWRHQIPVLGEHFRVVAPDLRGYHLTDKPAGGYDLLTLSDDVRELILALGAREAIVVGHDWGGAIAWVFAHRCPAMCTKLVILNAPHPLRFAEELRSNPQQLLKSWYILFFQLPWLPERLIEWNDYDFIEAAFRHAEVRPGSFSDAEIRRYKQAAAMPGAMTCALQYYRSALSAPPPPETYNQPVACPTLLIWGERDFALETRLTRNLERFVSGPLQVERLPDCSHWVHQEDPTGVNQLLVPFLTQPGRQAIFD
ncbi:alpha/beta fold hydrolase [Gloeobacter violaceus]|uniref:Gll4259 protein n=1 Tax=Gloeobacter violaceus (strain ATCC 29082 / PCC 7421) TaxID=251221 RepID=Q7NDH6_GLOVI|nr:alpha/beta hydrolase [Gloeobacter violaceus]BAC92200.1 gll4259 [Gloeobacter violaceus PCC 7421]